VSDAAQGSHGVPAFNHDVAVPSQIDDLVRRAPSKPPSLTLPTGKEGRAPVDETLQRLLFDVHARSHQMAELFLGDKIETKTRSDARRDLRSMHAAVLRYKDNCHGTFSAKVGKLGEKCFAADVGVAARNARSMAPLALSSALSSVMRVSRDRQPRGRCSRMCIAPKASRQGLALQNGAINGTHPARWWRSGQVHRLLGTALFQIGGVTGPKRLQAASGQRSARTDATTLGSRNPSETDDRPTLPKAWGSTHQLPRDQKRSRSTCS